MKRLVVCCDGTWNKPEQLSEGLAAPTNVSKLALAVAREDDAGTPQLVHYQRGVGTRALERIRGGALGVGLSRNVRECYRFLVENYEPGDELYFFGFSRGAFTARSTVGLVRNTSILCAHQRDRIEDAYRIYRSPRKQDEPHGIEADMFRRLYSHPLPEIHFVGVWDTVGALGIPKGFLRPKFLTRRWSFHDTTLSSHVRHAYHALSIDERRGAFEPTLWAQQERAEGQALEQVWFAGVHCDIGGGYATTGLSDIALLWMVEKARAAGLAFDPGRLLRVTAEPDDALRRAGVQVAPDALAEPHDSLTSFYRMLGVHDRLQAGATDGGAVASSAARRFAERPDYRPPGLSERLADGVPAQVPE